MLYGYFIRKIKTGTGSGSGKKKKIKGSSSSGLRVGWPNGQVSLHWVHDFISRQSAGQRKTTQSERKCTQALTWLNRDSSASAEIQGFNLRLLETPFSPGFKSLLVGVFVFATTPPMNQKSIQ